MEPTYRSGVKYRMIFTFLILGFLFPSCNRQQTILANDGYREIEVKYAEGFKLWENDLGYKIVVRNPQDTTELLATYFLSRDTSEIQIPIKRVAVGSTTLGSFFDKLDLPESISGMTYTDFILNENIKGLISSGQISELISGGELDFEKVIANDPDCFITYSLGQSNFDRINENGIPVLLLPEHMESSPLGRAEWVKVIGCLTDRLELAKQVFDVVDTSYTAIKHKALLSSYIPEVFTGSRYKDHWYAPGNRSYIATYLRDAGANYTFKHIEGYSSAEMDLESAIVQISGADFWGMVVSQDDDYYMNQLIEEDQKYAGFNSVLNGNVFACNSKKADYFGDGVVEPHLILADLISIFHPNILPNHSYKYFEPVKEN